MFTIFLEPLAALIRAESRIKGVIGGGREHKLFLYADDILVLSQDPARSVSVLLEIIEAYSKVSGYCINWHKSEAMPISQTCSCSQLSAFNFKWLPKGMKYLGIELDLDIGEIMTINMEKVLDKIQVNFDNWSKLHLTLWGKVNIIKMVVAPQINYITGMIPTCISKQQLIRYD